jgi:hypothetical protein
VSTKTFLKSLINSVIPSDRDNFIVIGVMYFKVETFKVNLTKMKMFNLLKINLQNEQKLSAYGIMFLAIKKIVINF